MSIQGDPTTLPSNSLSRPLAAGGRVDVRELVRMLNRRKWQLIGVTALVCAVTGLVLSQLTPEYRATALVMLDTRKAKVTNTADVLGGITADLPVMQTEIEVLRSASLLGRVVDKLKLAQDPEYGAARPSALGLLIRETKSRYEALVGSAGPSQETGATGEGHRLRAIAALQRNLTIGHLEQWRFRPEVGRLTG